MLLPILYLFVTIHIHYKQFILKYFINATDNFLTEETLYSSLFYFPF